ncbi:NUDIX hydrolase [Natrinema versiforme]|uniref:NUDIX hydrolase n=1 Tax=Natrinema versiforme JCM 10478 TaxID=1227496 RepID=L9Y685_9EURY|nr:NUDIX domain-containing protein [Natrinema versiforme]ELY68423.1 NUDIX hydrolase [Natrinema versiforme JCM 10478]
MKEITYVQKACAYITRGTGELLVFEGPGHDGLQIPKGTLEAGESPREALFREVLEESGLGALNGTSHLTTDIWTRREGRRYVRHFFHSTVHEPRDRWTHTVTDGGGEHGSEFEFRWVQPRTAREFALDLDEYVGLLPTATGTETITSLSD